MNESTPAPRRLRAFHAAAATLWWLLVGLWLALVLAWGALHGWIVPRIGEWRPVLEREASRVLGVGVRIGEISARSDALVPSFELRDVVLSDAQAREALRLPRVVIAVSPRSLWNLGFEQLYVEKPDLEVRRDAAGRLWVAGLPLPADASGDGRALDWFFRQHEVVVLGGSLRWVDELRQAPPLVLGDLRFVVRNGPRRHALRLDATPPEGWGRAFTLMGDLRSPLLSQHPGRWQDWSGQLHADFGQVDLAQLRAYASLGVDLQAGAGRLRAWVDVDRGRIAGALADLDLTRVEARLAEGRPALSLASASGRIAGRWSAPGAGFEFETQDLQFETADGQRWPGGNLALGWQPAEGSSPARGQVKADRLDLPALARLADRLPLDAALRDRLAPFMATGQVERLEAQWEGAPDAGGKYKVRARASGLTLPADPASRRPGLSGLTLDADFDQAGGKGRIEVARGAADLPGVLAEPRVPLDQLVADLQWQHGAERSAVQASGIRLANADVQAEGQASWRTGEGARRWPGVLDLQLTIVRAEGPRVWRYLPAQLPAAREYVRDAVLAGRAVDGRVRLKGDLHDFPFADPRSGEFRISAKVRDAVLAYVPAGTVSTPPAGARLPGIPAWAPLVALSGELVFDRQALQVRNARGQFAGATGLQVQAEASIPDLARPVVGVTGTVRGPLGQALSVFNASPLAASMGQPLARMAATGTTELRLQLSLPVAQIDQAKVQGSVALAGNDLVLAPGVPALARARGTVSFSERGFTLAGVQARALGGDVRIEGGTRVNPSATEPLATVRAQGTATAEGLRQSRELAGLAQRLARQAAGSTPYAVTVDLRPAGADVLVTSSLQGLALPLPAPLGKTAEAALPLRVQLQHPPGAARPQDQLRVEIGRAAHLLYVRDLAGSQPAVVRGAIAVGLAPGESLPPLPERGVLAQVNLPALDLDAWEDVLSPPAGASAAPVAPAVPSARGGLDAPGQDYLPTQLALRARELTLAGRTLSQVTVNGSREGLVWRGQVDASQVNGHVEYRQPSGSGAGRVTARLARLSLSAAGAGEVEALLDQQPASIPALDAVVEDFELRGKKLGRLEIDAVNRAAGGGAPAEWRLNRLSLIAPEATFTATGNWSAISAAPATPGPRGARPPERRRTAMNFRLEMTDAGQLLGRLGMKDVVRRGRGKLEGQVAWVGSPLALDYPSMNGAFNVNIEAGQFLKADPGLAKLLGVLSLQSLPRRLTLDFRDVFSEGFAFDFVRGDVSIAQGIASTNNLQMKGVNAAVLMEGRADIARETQDLRVVVVPEINAGTASVVAGVINPAVGLGSFLAQLILRQPLIRASTQELHIDGTWADPRVTRVTRQSSDTAPAPAGSPGGN